MSAEPEPELEAGGPEAGGAEAAEVRAGALKLIVAGVVVMAIGGAVLVGGFDVRQILLGLPLGFLLLVAGVTQAATGKYWSELGQGQRLVVVVVSLLGLLALGAGVLAAIASQS